MIARRRILALSFFPAFVPPDNGGVERLFNFYAELSHHHDVTLVSSSFLNGEREVIRHRPYFTEIRVPKDAHFANAYEELRPLSGEGDISGPALGRSLVQFGALHDEYLAHYVSADVIIHESPFLIECDLFRGFDSKVRIYNSYNCETDLYASFHAEERGAGVIADLVQRLEQDLCRHCDLITVCSDEDAAAFQRHFQPNAGFIKVPNGFVPRPSQEVEVRAARRVIFLGSAHKPNIDAVRFIVDELAPALRDVEFHLVGSCHSVGRAGNVVGHGVVSQQVKEELLRSATAAINPMMTGGGSSLKIADIASNGCPLLSTDLGARGFDLAPEVHYLSLDKDPVATIRRALDDHALLQRIAERALDHFQCHYSWGEIAAAFVQRVQPLLARPVSAPNAKLVLNDYDSLRSVGGGATRTQGLCRGLADSSPVIFLALGDTEQARRVSEDGRILSLSANKSPQHLAEHEWHNELHWVSTADIVNYRHAPGNSRLMALFRSAASCSSTIICEHPYMVGLPRAFGVDFVYSSQNVEANLKAEGLRDHPLRDELLPLVREAEAFACAASTFIVAVSDADATDLSATYRSTAPILVVANGADGPATEAGDWTAEANTNGRPIATFMGSMHKPNLDAARWIANDLAERMPYVDFTIVGSVAESLEGPIRANVRLVGQVSAIEKSRQLQAATVALNPMMSGSGSNVKMADYLQHGLPVLTTAFGARGYEWLPRDDAVVASLENFESELQKLFRADRAANDGRRTRQATYATKLSMTEGGRRLARLIDEHAGQRRKALYVTYRYNDPARGGGEEYVVRLVHALAASGWEVDIVSPAVERIVDVDRFSAQFSGPESQPVPIGHPRVRSAKFPLDPGASAKSDLKGMWNCQSDFEEHVARSLRPPAAACLAWGWAEPEAGGRWCLRFSGIHLPEAGTLRLRATAAAPMWVQIYAADGRRVHAVQADAGLEVDCDLPAGFVTFHVSMTETPTAGDPRPLALFVSELSVEGRDILQDRVSELWADTNAAKDRMAALVAARVEVRDAHDLALSPMRAASARLDGFVRDAVGDFDLLITHNAVFNSTTSAIDSAAAAGVPSILIPHLHYDDDFYHFRDLVSACAKASATLVSPRCVKDMLALEGLGNLAYHTPGVDVSRTYSDADVAAFRNILPHRIAEFFLVLGRKSAAKGYADVIAALADFPVHPPAIVMIGPDEDGVPIDNPNVVCLGRQPEQVVRGALRECLGLINMSRSESFGMVLVEAGLAGKPVLANRNCAAFADIIEDGANGYLVSRDELPARMLALQSAPVLRQRLGDEARHRARKYDWTIVEQEFVQICDDLVARK